jgi:hypothetical protein
MYRRISKGVLVIATGEHIPENPKETKWQEFLAWQAAGNSPDPEHTDLELLEQAREAKRLEIQAAYEAAEAAPVTVGLFTYQGGMEAAVELDRIIRTGQLLSLSECDVPDVDGIDRALALADAQAVLKAILTVLRPLTKSRRKKLREIKVATNVAEVEAVTW